VITFRSSVVEERPEDVRAFLRAWVEAVKYRQEHADECNQIIARILDIPLEEVAGDAQIYTLEDNLASFANATEEDEGSIYSVARSQLDFLTGMGLVTTWPDLHELLDDSFLE
jgi:NitT/TauT family transport system substrate-binding protein